MEVLWPQESNVHGHNQGFNRAFGMLVKKHNTLKTQFCSFTAFCYRLRLTAFSMHQPTPPHFCPPSIKAVLPPSPLCPLHPKTMCGMSFQLPLHWRRAPNKTKQLSVPSLGPGLHLLSLSKLPLPPAQRSLHSFPSLALCVTISRGESLLSASQVERLADFRLHVSFRCLGRSSGPGQLWQYEKGELPMRERWRGGERGNVVEWMNACSAEAWAGSCCVPLKRTGNGSLGSERVGRIHHASS